MAMVVVKVNAPNNSCILGDVVPALSTKLFE